MANKVIYLNGTAFYPTTIERNEVKVGTRLEMANGNLKFFYRRRRVSWTITWNNAPETLLNSIRTIQELNTTFTLTDEYGVNYTVMIADNEYNEQLEAANISRAGLFYYTYTLSVVEA